MDKNGVSRGGDRESVFMFDRDKIEIIIVGDEEDIELDKSSSEEPLQDWRNWSTEAKMAAFIDIYYMTTKRDSILPEKDDPTFNFPKFGWKGFRKDVDKICEDLTFLLPEADPLYRISTLASSLRDDRNHALRLRLWCIIERGKSINRQYNAGIESDLEDENENVRQYVIANSRITDIALQIDTGAGTAIVSQEATQPSEPDVETEIFHPPD